MSTCFCMQLLSCMLAFALFPKLARLGGPLCSVEQDCGRGRLQPPWLATIPVGMNSKLPAVVIARRPKPRDPEPRLDEAKPLRIVFARKPARNTGCLGSQPRRPIKDCRLAAAPIVGDYSVSISSSATAPTLAPDFGFT